MRRQSEVSSLIRERTRQQRAEEEEEERRQQAAVTPVLQGLQHRQPPPRVSWVPLPSSTPLPPASRWRADDEGDGEEEEEEEAPRVKRKLSADSRGSEWRWPKAAKK